jgi:hypothetical protein
MLLQHINLNAKAQKLEMALDICNIFEKKLVITGRSDGVTCAEFADYVMTTVKDPNLEQKWRNFTDTR